jgi:glycosyltransferase involved in cell wall biosynthesis
MNQNDMSNKNRTLESLEKRRSRVGSLGALDFLIAFERRRRSSNDLKTELNAVKREQASGAITRESPKAAVLTTRDKKNTKREKQASDRKKIDVIRKKLFCLGFTERPLAELTEIANTSQSANSRALAARELALWYMREKSDAGYRTVLDWIACARPDAPDFDFLAKLNTVELLCHYFLNQPDEGFHVYDRATRLGEVTPDVMLARANFEFTPEARIHWINKVLDHYNIPPVALLPDEGQPAYDRLRCGVKLHNVADGPKVTVLIAAYNAAGMLPTALRSLQEQTWRNLEIIVLDDCSPSAGTCDVAERFAAADPRIRLIRMNENGGAYVARNRGIGEATGEFVTLHDADDWSHPLKIETQVRFMMENPLILGCTSEQARCTENIVFGIMRRNIQLVTSNTSSLLFKRTEFISTLGHWDTARFGADGELLQRMRMIYGKSSLKEIKSGPLSFQRYTDTSLTGDQFFGYEGYKFGARRAYEEIYKVIHKNLSCLTYNISNTHERIYYAPAPMRASISKKVKEKKYFDVVIASDFRFPGGTSSSNAEEIKAQKAVGLKTALVELYWYGMNVECELNEKIVQLLEEGVVELVSYGEEIACDTLIIRQPMTLDPMITKIPSVEAKSVRVIINQTPKRDYGEGSEDIYDLKACANNVAQAFGQLGTWHPIGPLVRDALVKHHRSDLQAIDLSPDDWTNIINASEWRRSARPVYKDRPIRICRHSRDGYVKWPSDPQIIKTVYPENSDFEIHVLGGATTPQKILGGTLPGNWHVTEFGVLHPKDFLTQQDVFVYFTHPAWIESFGRAIFEPMCVGVPVILPQGHGYEKLFGKAAIYAQAHEVAGIVRKLMAESKLYENQVQNAAQIVRERFSYETHYLRLNLKGKKAVDY